MSWLEKHFITNELTRKRFRRFKKDKVAVVSLLILLALFFFSFTAELWCNSKPTLMKYRGEIYFPLVKTYHPSVFGRENEVVMDYRTLEFSKGDWAIWPVVQWDPYESNSSVETYPSPPTKYNWFGTDDRGRDVFTRLLYGFRYTFIYALSVWALSYFIGAVLGAVMGYWGGTLDLIGQRVVEVIQSVDTFFLVITLIAIFGSSLWLLVLVNVLFGWTGIMAQTRGQFLQLRKREFVEAARALGSSDTKIVFKHILPNALAPIITFSPFSIAANVLGLSSLDYLGLGIPAPTPSWGELISEGQKYITIAEWLVWGPNLILLLTLLLLINIGLAVRDAYDARA